MTFSVWFSQWYRAKQFAEEKAEGRIEGQTEVWAEDIKFLKDRGFHAAAAVLESLAREQDVPSDHQQSTERS